MDCWKKSCEGFCVSQRKLFLGNLVALLGANDLNPVVPAQQTDLRNIGPVAMFFPQGFTAVGAAWSRRDFTLREFVLKTRIGPDRLAFIAQDATGQSPSARVLAHTNSAKSVAANRAMLDVDQKRFGHRWITGWGMR